ncbi:response regulator [Desertivirga xinjiangensis]|uniref:response regulator n=1 Tax=Desertivirga xinjiangensis TaxID=539206 RepID=UPI00210B6856|nr:response regulator [Pedobacter xinjiangensis]
MIKVLIVDDSNDKIAKVIKTLREVADNIKAEVVIDLIGAQKNLLKSQYDLLILDMNLPVRQGESPSTNNGKNLLLEITRKKTFFSPRYIAFLTQYPEECQGLSTVWPIIKYTADSDAWTTPVVEYLTHIKKTKIHELQEIKIQPAIYLEGKTDEAIILEAIKLHRPELLEKVELKSEKSGGASWVARQVIAWSHMLHRTDKGEEIKSVGLFDGDNAGAQAIEEINRVVKLNSAEGRTFKTFKLSATYARHLIPIKQKGIDLPVCLEEMFPFEQWKFAEAQGWVEQRNNGDHLLSDPKQWNKYTTTLIDHFNNLGLTSEEKVFLNCFKLESKEKFAEYLLNLNETSKIKAFQSFKTLIEDFNNFLF